MSVEVASVLETGYPSPFHQSILVFWRLFGFSFPYNGEQGGQSYLQCGLFSVLILAPHTMLFQCRTTSFVLLGALPLFNKAPEACIVAFIETDCSHRPPKELASRRSCRHHSIIQYLFYENLSLIPRTHVEKKVTRGPLSRQRQCETVFSWSSLAGQPSLLDAFQATENLFQKHKSGLHEE